MATAAPGDSVHTRVCDALAHRLGPKKFGLWFDGRAIIGVEDQILRVKVPNRFQADWIERNYQGEIKEAATATLGGQFEVHIVVCPQSFPDRRGDASNDAGRPAHGAGARMVSPDRPASGFRTVIHPGGVEAWTGSAASGPNSGSAETQAQVWFSNGERSPAGSSESMLLDPRFDLARFVVGSCNELAWHAAHRLAEGERGFHIVFVHGKCGLGKTHLLRGVCRRTLTRHPQARVRYMTGEEFTTEYVTAIKANKVDRFRRVLRSLDLLAIDDVHFLSQKQATQNEFLSTFNAIDMSGARVVLASDNHPQRIQAFSQSLVSRFMAGMVVEVAEPDRGTRMRLIAALAARRGMRLSEGAIERLADICVGSVRDIEGHLVRLSAMVQLMERNAGSRTGMTSRDHAPQSLLFEHAPAGPQGAGAASDSAVSVDAHSMVQPRILTEELLDQTLQSHDVQVASVVRRNSPSLPSAGRDWGADLERPGEHDPGEAGRAPALPRATRKFPAAARVDGGGARAELRRLAADGSSSGPVSASAGRVADDRSETPERRPVVRSGEDGRREAAAGADGEAIGAVMVDRMLRAANQTDRPRRPVPPALILDEVASYFGIGVADILCESKHRQLVAARSIAAYLIRQMTTMSFPETARAMQRKNHSTIVAQVKRVQSDLEMGATVAVECRTSKGDLVGDAAGERSVRSVLSALQDRILRRHASGDVASVSAPSGASGASGGVSGMTRPRITGSAAGGWPLPGGAAAGAAARPGVMGPAASGSSPSGGRAGGSARPAGGTHVASGEGAAQRPVTMWADGGDDDPGPAAEGGIPSDGGARLRSAASPTPPSMWRPDGTRNGLGRARRKSGASGGE